MGGLLLGGLFGMLMGTGFGGGFGFLGLLLQGLLIFFLIRFAMRMFANRQAPASGPSGGPGFGGFGGMSRDNQSGDQPRPSFQIPKIGGGAAASASARSGPADELGITPKDLERFEQLLQEMQRAYAEEDYGALRRITTPEAMSYLAEELSENATKGVRNTVRDVHLVQGDVAESWAEDKMEYATVAMRYEAIEGDANTPVESVEIWTFARRPSTQWQISAIQGTN
jgi:predicted lipid-binding transport protein (Tim44 family)